MPLYARRFFTVVDILSETLAIAMLVVAFGVVALGVAGRYVLVTPFPWTVEIGRFAFIWLCLSGIALTERRRAHFQITFIAEGLPLRAQRVLAVVREIVIFTVLALFMVESIKFGYVGANSISSVLELPLSYVYLALPVAVVLTAINRIRCILEDALDPDLRRTRREAIARGEQTGGSA
ncbi:MAG: hypothetical protein AcusKO_47110 [Acuticoccus sp.]